MEGATRTLEQEQPLAGWGASRRTRRFRPPAGREIGVLYVLGCCCWCL